jgi:hypothetical protein
MRRVVRAIVVLAAFALAACGGAGSSAKQTVTVTASSTKPSGQQEYSSVQALADDLTKHGYTCAMKPRGSGSDGSVSGECWILRKQMILVIYPNQAAVNDYLRMIHSIVDLGNDPFGWLVGNKWIVNCGERAACQAIQDSLGGTVDAR